MAYAIRSIPDPAAFQAAFQAAPAALARLQTYERLLRQWQTATNLVAPSTLEAVWHRHFADSAQLLPLAPDAKTWLDLGSGGGFPGLVIAILLARDAAVPLAPSPAGDDPGPPEARAPAADPRAGLAPAAAPPAARDDLRKVTLVESDARKCAFLREVVRQTGIQAGIAVDILSTRAESLATQGIFPPPDVVTARALAPLGRLFALAAPLSPPSAVGLYLKGKEAVREVEDARQMWTFEAELIPSLTDPQARIVVVRNLERKAKD